MSSFFRNCIFVLLLMNSGNLFAQGHPGDAMRFYSTQIKANLEKLESLEGDSKFELRMSCNSASFRYPEGKGVGRHDIKGNFISQLVQQSEFKWELLTDRLVSIQAPSLTPIRYFYVSEPTREVKYEEENEGISVGVESKVLVDNKKKISTSFGQVGPSGEKLFEATQDRRHELDSPKTMFNISGESIPSRLGRIGASIKESGDGAESCQVNIEGNLHVVEMKPPKSKNKLKLKWVFDADQDFMLIEDSSSYDDDDNGQATIKTTWKYQKFGDIFIPTEMCEKREKANGQDFQQITLSLDNILVNSEFEKDTFELKALSPDNGDLLVNKETGESYIITEGGEELLDTKMKILPSNRFTAFWLLLGLLAILGVTFVLKKRPA